MRNEKLKLPRYMKHVVRRQLEALPHEVKVQVDRMRVEEAHCAEHCRANAHGEVETRDIRQSIVPRLDATRHLFKVIRRCDTNSRPRTSRDVIGQLLW